MAKNENNTTEQNIDIEVLKAQIEEQIRAEYELKEQEKAAQAEQDKKVALEKLANQEKNLEAQIAAEEKTLRKLLDAMPKVSIEIPMDNDNPNDVAVVGWNGIIYSIPKGQQFEVPKVIYDIWKESHVKTMAVQRKIRESINKEIKVIA